VIDGGVVILSKYPIIAKDALIYDHGVASDVLAAKGALYAKIKLKEGCCFHLFATHLQATYYDPKSLKVSSTFEAIRVSQLLELQEFIKRKTMNDSLPIILVGDFNVKAILPGHLTESEEYQRMIHILSGSSFYVTDVLNKISGSHPPTVGDVLEEDGHLVAKETVLTGTYDQLRPVRLDYIFWLTRNSLLSNNTQEKHINQKRPKHRFSFSGKESLRDEIICGHKSGHLFLSHAYKEWFQNPIENYHKDVQNAMNSVCIVDKHEEKLSAPCGNYQLELVNSSIEQFLVQDQNFTQLSDHYGIDCIIALKQVNE